MIAGLRPGRPSLATEVARLSAPGPAPLHPTGRPRAVLAHLGRSVGVDRAVPDRLGTDLALLGRDLDAHVATMTTAAVTGLGIGLLLAPVAGLAMGAWMALVGVAAGLVLPTIVLRRAATERRREFRHAFGAFLDVVAVSLAGGRGVEGALVAASTAGAGWSFDLLRTAIDVAGLRGETPWAALDRQGEGLDLPELREFAATVALAGNEGARVRSSIAAKAASLRARGLADDEADATAASVRMSLPTVILLLGFLVFVGYPSISLVLSGL